MNYALKLIIVPLAFWPLSLPVLAAETPLALPEVTIDAWAEGQSTNSLTTENGTASRLGLTPLETPASLSIIGGEEARQRNNLSVQDAVSRSPGISRMGNPGNGGMALSARGFTGQNSVMQLYDGTRLYIGYGTATFPTDLWSVERIEVLRGPASVLYGEGATGAVVNVVSKQPLQGPIQNHLRLGYGSYDRRQMAFDSGGQLSEQFSYRLNLNQEAGNGWVDRGDWRSTAISAALRWQANDNLSFTLAHDYGDQHPQPYLGTPLVDGHLRDSLRDHNFNVRNARLHYDDQWTLLTTEWKPDTGVEASNQLYYLKTQRSWRNAESYTWQPDTRRVSRSDYWQIGHKQEQIGDRQDFTFHHGLFGLDSRTVVGADINRIRFVRSHNFDNEAFDFVDLKPSEPGQFLSTDPYGARERNKARQFSLFAENRTALTEQLSVVSGFRRDNVHLDRVDLLQGSRSDRSLTGDNWRIGLVYALSDDVSLYGQYSTSTDSVGSLLTLSPGQQAFDLAKARQSEVGLKQVFWEGRGAWTIAAFHIVKKNLLTSDAANRSYQVGQQSSDGVEASLEMSLLAGWTLDANVAWVRARYDDFTQGGTDYSGNRPLDVPRRTANLWLEKTFAPDWTLGAGARYVDARYQDYGNTTKLPGYTVVDTNLHWQAQPELGLGLSLNNVFDRRYAEAGYNGGQQWILGEPRSLFLTADYQF